MFLLLTCVSINDDDDDDEYSLLYVFTWFTNKSSLCVCKLKVDR